MKLINGNLLSARTPFIMHGCNAQGVMGSGVAKALRDYNERIFRDYRRAYETDGLKLGDVIPVDGGDWIVLNAITQEFYGRDGKRYASYDAITEAVLNTNTLASGQAVAMPMIGCGLGGLRWSVVKQILVEYAHFEPVVYFL